MQCTLKKEITVPSVDLVSGNHSRVILSPAKENTGIVFRTPKEEIQADLDNAYAMTFPCKTIILKGERTRVAVVEHILAQLSISGVDNAYIALDKTPSWTSRLFKPFGSARNMQFVPDFGSGLCERLEGNLQEQGERRKYLTLDSAIGSDRFRFVPNHSKDTRIYAGIDYKLASGEHVVQESSCLVEPSLAKDISSSRHHCIAPSFSPKFFTKGVANLAFLSHGYGNGNDEFNAFYSPRTAKEWQRQERMENELVRHTIMDRLGEIALLGKKLTGVNIYCKGAGHKYAVDFLKENRDRFVPLD